MDTGLRRVVVTRGGADLGKALECAVHAALRRHHRDLYYWRERGGVDFVLDAGGQLVPILVTWDCPSERHQRALEDFYERFPQAGEAVVVTADDFEVALGALT